MGTNISWTDETVNPIQGVRPNRWFCRRISPGCDNCYSDTFNRRLGGSRFGEPGAPESYIAENVRLDMGQLSKIARLKKPSKVFVCDMTDLFGEWVPDEWISRIFAFMELNPQHTFQVLTKRARRMRDWCQEHAPIGRNIWLGVTVESQNYGWRLNYLAETPAAVRFISAEPLLGPLGLWKWFYEYEHHWQCACGWQGPDSLETLADSHPDECPRCGGGGGLTFVRTNPFHWVIVGGESGPNHRPMQLQWARDIKGECEATGAAFWFKQDAGPRPGMGADALGAVYQQFPEAGQ